MTAVVGLDGLFHEHAMLRPKSGSATPGPAPAPAPPVPRRRDSGSGSGAQNHDVVAHASTPQACPAAQASAFGGHLHVDADVLDLRAGPAVRPGPHRARPDDRHRGVRAVLPERLQRVRVLLRAVQPHPQRGRRRRARRAAGRRGRGRARHRAGVLQRAGSASLVVYEAPNDNDAQALDLFNRIAGDDTAQVVTTSWGNCEADDRRRGPSRRRTRSSTAWPCRGRP